MTLLQTEGLTKRFGSMTAVDSVDFHLEEGGIASIIGPNGAGKTTFFNLITGEYEVTEGSITFKGEDVTDTSSHERINQGMGRVFQISNVFPELTTFENVRLAVQSIDRGDESGLLAKAHDNQAVVDTAHEILEDLGLHDRRSMTADSLPYGDKRRLEIGMAVALEPDLLLMDEPAAGLPEEDLHEVIDFIETIAEDHTVLLVEHKMDVVMGLSDRISVLHEGRLIADGTAEDIRNNEEVKRVYLGEDGQYA
ncbi:ABC transporter ATP-binding protein [Haloarchaeobius sp. HRN-SO-5]|uniref:ABC transporter ATP-binding protein n=1 Tax=Haloarchaeobius sp. HRN-SO-5 TaxID=3446118 RepID=UPI003EB7D02E